MKSDATQRLQPLRVDVLICLFPRAFFVLPMFLLFVLGILEVPSGEAQHHSNTTNIVMLRGRYSYDVILGVALKQAMFLLI